MTNLTKRRCVVCKSNEFRDMGTRIDNHSVILCERCGMGVLDDIPDDLSIFYNDGYYGDEAGPALGYTDNYSKMSFHTTAWAAFLGKLLKSSGQVLDIGCVDGFLLKQFGPKFAGSGIEMNGRMSLLAQKGGVNIIGSDLMDYDMVAAQAGKFDLITAIAVFEHLRDIRRGVENALHLLADDGILLFEVPLISSQNDNTVWFNSSLEHVFYPTVDSLRYLVQNELNYKLIGSEIFIREYASTYIGIICKSPLDVEKITSIFERIMGASENLQSDAERIARVHLRLIHAADSTPDLIADMHLIPHASLEPALISRIQQVWGADLRHLKNYQESYNATEKARDFWHGQADRWEVEARKNQEVKE